MLVSLCDIYDTGTSYEGNHQDDDIRRIGLPEHNNIGDTQ